MNEIMNMYIIMHYGNRMPPARVQPKKNKRDKPDELQLTPTQIQPEANEEEEKPKPKSQKRKGSNDQANEEEPEEGDKKKKKAKAPTTKRKGKEVADDNEGGDEEEQKPVRKIQKTAASVDAKKKHPKETNRYAILREMSGGIIEDDQRGRNPCKTRKDVMDKYALKDSNGKPLATVRIKYAMCYIDKDDKIKAAIGSEVGLVRGTVSTADFVASFLKHGWESQYAGICTIHVTEEVAGILSKMTLAEQTAWLSHPDTLAKYPQYIIDGAHRVELGGENFGPDHEGVFCLLHPCCPFENRERTALSSNSLSIMNNTTNFRDRMVYVFKKVKYGYTCKEIKDDVQGSWGEEGAMSQLKQCAETLDLKGWTALSMDYDSVNQLKKAPFMTIALCLYPLFKSMPDEVRGDVLLDIVNRTLKKENYPGCGLSSRKPGGREQALWVSTLRHLCQREISLGNKSKFVIIKAMFPTDITALDAKFKNDDINNEIARAVGVGDGKEWNPPTVDNKKATTGNVMQAVNALMKKILGEPFFQAKADKEEEEEEDEESVAAEEVEFREHPVECAIDACGIVGDATSGKTWNSAIGYAKGIFKDYPVKRIHVVSSPPWGVLQGQTSDGQDDAALTPSSIGEV
jgi:hypothetical protein